MTLNPRLDGLGEYTFTQLNQLLASVAPRANETPVMVSVGDPLHEPPAFLAETVARNAHLWNKYPNPGEQYIRVALVHDNATIASALERLVRVI